MKKILLVFEDYSELTTTEVYLKKIGFDVVGISNEVIINDQLVAFNPDIVVAFGKGQRVSTINIGIKLKDNRKFVGKVVLVMPVGVKPSPQDIIKMRMDAALEAPIDPLRLIQVLAKLGKLDTSSLIEKLKKATYSDPQLKAKVNFLNQAGHTEEKITVVKEKGLDREARYAQFLDGVQLDLTQTSFQKADVKQRQSELKKDWNFEELQELDQLKREFADALFKKI